MSKKVLIVDDSKFSRTLLRVPLVRLGFSVTMTAGPREAMASLSTDKPDLIITDLKMPSLMDGLGFLRQLGLEMPAIPVLVYSADPDPANTVGPTGIHKIRFIQKPIKPDALEWEILESLSQVKGFSPD